MDHARDADGGQNHFPASQPWRSPRRWHVGRAGPARPHRPTNQGLPAKCLRPSTGCNNARDGSVPRTRTSSDTPDQSPRRVARRHDPGGTGSRIKVLTTYHQRDFVDTARRRVARRPAARRSTRPANAIAAVPKGASIIATTSGANFRTFWTLPASSRHSRPQGPEMWG